MLRAIARANEFKQYAAGRPVVSNRIEESNLAFLNDKLRGSSVSSLGGVRTAQEGENFNR